MSEPKCFDNPGDDVNRPNAISVNDCTINERGNHKVGMDQNTQNVNETLIAQESKGNSNVGQSQISESSTPMPTTKADDRHELVFKSQNENDEVITNVDAPVPKQYDPSIDERLPETVTLLHIPGGGKLYLIGTAHFSIKSQNEVSMMIQAVQPHTVVVELCSARVGILHLDEKLLFERAKNLSYQYILQSLREYGPYNGLIHVLLLRIAASAAKQLGMAPGGEFRRAFEEAKKVPNCVIHLADRPIDITLQRAIRKLTWWQTIVLCWEMLTLSWSISSEDVEFYKERSFLEVLINDLEKGYPAVGESFIRERDLFLTYSLQMAALRRPTPHSVEPPRVVGIVGMGHVPGIVDNWGKVQSSDIQPIMSIPPQALSSKILVFTIKASLLSAVIYMGYKYIPLPSGLTLRSIESSVQGLLKPSSAYVLLIT